APDAKPPARAALQAPSPGTAGMVHVRRAHAAGPSRCLFPSARTAGRHWPRLCRGYCVRGLRYSLPTLRSRDSALLRCFETLFAALIPVALTLPIQWMVAGPRAIVASAITGVFGFLWVEALLRDWRRIPFTCSYMPGKHTVAQSVLTGLSLFLIVSTIGSAIETASLRGPSSTPGLVI